MSLSFFKNNCGCFCKFTKISLPFHGRVVEEKDRYLSVLRCKNPAGVS